MFGIVEDCMRALLLRVCVWTYTLIHTSLMRKQALRVEAESIGSLKLALTWSRSRPTRPCIPLPHMDRTSCPCALCQTYSTSHANLKNTHAMQIWLVERINCCLHAESAQHSPECRSCAKAKCPNSVVLSHSCMLPLSAWSWLMDYGCTSFL